jgi:hypothetical protein
MDELTELEKKLLANLSAIEFVRLVELALWITEAERHGYELNYLDGEIIQFKKVR